MHNSGRLLRNSIKQSIKKYKKSIIYGSSEELTDA